MRLTASRLLALALFPVIATPALAETGPDWGPWRSADWGWGHMAFGGVTMLLVFAGVILLIVLLLRGVGGLASTREPAAPARPTALEVLQERYARGEIDKQEYEERRKTLAA